jgi:hypothetical protein
MATNNAVNVGLSGTTGSGSFVGSTSPTLTTPNIGSATATSLTVTNGTSNTFLNVTAAGSNTYAVLSLNKPTATSGGSYIAMSENSSEIWVAGMTNGDSNYHIFNSAASKDCLSIDNSGNVSIGNTSASVGLILNNNTGSYTPGTLNYYEETSVSMSVSGAWVETVTLYITRMGRQVTLTYSDLSTGSAAAATLISTAGVIPARFRPLNTINWVVFGRNNATNTSLFCSITSAGTIGWAPSGAANFTAGAAAAAWGANLTYTYNV